MGPPNDIKILKLFPGGSTSTGVDCELIYMFTKSYSKNIDLEIKNEHKKFIDVAFVHLIF